MGKHSSLCKPEMSKYVFTVERGKIPLEGVKMWFKYMCFMHNYRSIIVLIICGLPKMWYFEIYVVF